MKANTRAIERYKRNDFAIIYLKPTLPKIKIENTLCYGVLIFSMGRYRFSSLKSTWTEKLTTFLLRTPFRRRK